MNLCNLHITGALKQLFVYLSNAATPLSLMSVGAGLIVSMHIRKLVSISYATVLKLVAMPLITIALVHYFGATGVPASIAILYSAVPCAGNAYILARQMGAIMKRWPPLSLDDAAVGDYRDVHPGQRSALTPAPGGIRPPGVFRDPPISFHDALPLC